MNAFTAIKDFHDGLQSMYVSTQRRDFLEITLVDAIKECLDIFPEKYEKKKILDLRSCEVLPVQHFLNQFGFHLKRIHKPSDSEYGFGTNTYKVVPNWK